MSAASIDIPVDLVKPHASNVRRDLGDLTELAASIKGMGVLQPLTVAPDPGAEAAGSREYVLIAGHRRHAAAVQAGVETVPCIVRADLDTQVKQIQSMLVENLQRTDLTVMEEADAYAQLELLGVKEAAIVKTTGRSRKTVHERILLASLPTERREQYEKGQLSLEGAVKCAKLREQYADDAEILAKIDDAATYAFSTNGYGIDYTINRILEDRSRPDEPEDDQDDEGTIDFAGQRAEREVKWEKERQEQAARREQIIAMWKRQADWFHEVFVEQEWDEEELGQLANAALSLALRDGGYDLDEDAAAAAGITIETDAEHDTRSADFSTADALLYCILAATTVSVNPEPSNWEANETSVRERLGWLMSLGYEPDADEQALLDTQEADDAVA